MVFIEFGNISPEMGSVNSDFNVIFIIASQKIESNCMFIMYLFLGIDKQIPLEFKNILF